MEHETPLIFYLLMLAILAWCLYVSYRHRDDEPGLGVGMAWVASFPVITIVVTSEKFPWIIALLVTALSLALSFYVSSIFKKRHIAKQKAEQEVRERRFAEQIQKLDAWLEKYRKIPEG